MNARLIQAIALSVLVVCSSVCGMLLTPILRLSERAGLRYTDISVEGAPPFVVLGTAIGALRGLVVNYLWIKINIMKSKGLFYEVMADADLLTKLQPRFAQVWAFHGHNMAYNISVATHTKEERWAWVNAGIRLVRNKGIRYNPNDLVLYKELAFWFAHKIEGYADDAHLYYKTEFTREWHFLLGEPPIDYQARVDWIQKIADAPESLADAERRTTGVLALVDRLNAALTPYGEGAEFAPTFSFLERYAKWEAVTQSSHTAELLGFAAEYRLTDPYFSTFDEIAGDPAVRDAWETLISFARKRVLIDEYNMDPQFMYELTSDLGPIDWRHGQAHALYWSSLGAKLGETRVGERDEIYKIINNDRLRIQALQDLARYGRITFDPFSTELPARFSEPRWIDTIDRMFADIYAKHFDARGGGPETFATFLQNFMGSAIREAYRSGEIERAETMLARLDRRFGSGAMVPNNLYKLPLEIFVRNQIAGEIDSQPHIGPSETLAAMRNGFRTGVARGDEEKYERAENYCRQIIDLFKNNEMWDFKTKFQDRRMADLVSDLPTIKRASFAQLMSDPSVPMLERQVIWSEIDKFEPLLRVQTYDQIVRQLEPQFARHEFGRMGLAFDEVFPTPPGLDAYRQLMAVERAKREAEARDKSDIDEIERQE